MKLKSKKIQELKEVDLDDKAEENKPRFALPVEELPSLPSLSSKELGEFHSMCSGYMLFLNEQIAEAKMDEYSAKMRWRRKRAEALLSATGNFKAKQFAAVRCRIDVKDLEDAYMEKKRITMAWQSNFWTMKNFMDAARFDLERRRWTLKTFLDEESTG